MKNKFKGAQQDLIEIVKSFHGNHEIKFFISERGNQRIEITDLDSGEVWESLEEVQPNKNIDNFDDISYAMIWNFAQMESKL